MFPRTPDALKVRRRIAGAATAASGHNTHMDIILNGQSLPLPDQTTLAALLEAQHLAQRRVAVEINGWAYHRSSDRFEADGDKAARLAAAGWLELPLTWKAIRYRPEECIARLVAALNSRTEA